MTKPLVTEVRVIEWEGKLYRVMTTYGGILAFPFDTIEVRMRTGQFRVPSWRVLSGRDARKERLLAVAKEKEPDMLIEGLPLISK